MWIYFGTLFNVAAVVIGSLIGLTIKKKQEKHGISKNFEEYDKREKLTDSISFCLALCILMASVPGLVRVKNEIGALICTVALIVGYLFGYFLRINDNLNKFCGFLVGKFRKNKEIGASSASVGIISASILFCTGSMVILGPIESAANTGASLVLSDHTTLIIKSFLDLVSAACLTITFGFAVSLSCVAVFVIEGAFTLFASELYPFFMKIDALDNITCVGSVILIALALDFAGIKKVKTADYIPAIFLALLFSYLYSLIR